MTLKAKADTAARELLCGAFQLAALADNLASMRPDGIKSWSILLLARRLVREFGQGSRPKRREVAAFLSASPAFGRLFPHFLTAETEPSMQPAEGPTKHWRLPEITTLGALADWLKLDLATLHWLRAGWRQDAEREGRLRHYRFRWIPRRGGRPRLIEAPMPRLKAVQRRILSGILDHIPVHPAAHGFVRGRGITTFTAPHAGKRCVLRMDLQDFFPTIRRALVLRVFLTAGYPETVAAALADLCTTATPAAVLREGLTGVPSELAWHRRKRFQSRHLPQGAPTSPALANLCAFRMDARLTGLASRFGAVHTRYADDLLFSGGENFRRDVERCQSHVSGILLELGFAVAHRKTRIMPDSVSQRAAGLVLNAHAALPRTERDQLKAILTNCVRHGPDSQNREGHADFRAHLLGRISHAAFVNPSSAEKLKALFVRIDWSAGPA